jgi:hypothetical protein
MQSDQLLIPSSLEDHLGFWLRFVSNHVSLRFQKLLENESVTVTEWVALRTLWNESESSHATLIEALGMTKGAASKVINRLEERKVWQKESWLMDVLVNKNSASQSGQDAGSSTCSTCR